MKLSYRDIFKLGQKISEGFGFWSNRALLGHADRDDLVKAWVDALRAKGFSDMDLILYGDWTDARHIADNIAADTDYATFKKAVQSQSRGAHEVAETNQNEYPDDVLQMLREATGIRISRIVARVVAAQEWGIQWAEFDRNDRKVTKEKVFSSKAQRDAFTDKLEKKDNFAEFLAWLGDDGDRISRITDRVTARTRQNRIARESPYSNVIKPILLRMGRRDIDPRHVEAYMTLAHRTLDGLSQQQFTREMLDIVEAIDANPRQAEQLADSYGL